MSDKYFLENGAPVRCDDLFDWANRFDREDRVVGSDYVYGIHVSTVFLGIDHSFGEGPPILWETMIFGGKHDEFQERYSSLVNARDGHLRALAMVENDATLIDGLRHAWRFARAWVRAIWKGVSS